jgi:prevent-host-death family protein
VVLFSPSDPDAAHPVIAQSDLVVAGMRGAGLSRRVAHETGELYDSYMTEMAVSEAREHLAELIDSAQRTGEPVYLTRRGRAVAVVVDPVVFEKLLEDAEDALDRAELAIARDEDDYVPWEQVKADLGLT